MLCFFCLERVLSKLLSAVRRYRCAALSQSGVSLFYFFGNVAVNQKGQYCQRHGKEKQRVKQRNGKMLVKKSGNNRAKRHADIYADVKGTAATLC